MRTVLETKEFICPNVIESTIDFKHVFLESNKKIKRTKLRVSNCKKNCDIDGYISRYSSETDKKIVNIYNQ